MSWGKVKKINSNLDTPLDELLGSDADNAAFDGSIHAKIKALFSCVAIATDTVQASASAERSTSSVTPVKLKAIVVPLPGQVRIKLKTNRLSGHTGSEVSVRVNDSTVAAFPPTPNYGETHIVDLEGLNAGDCIQIYAKASGATNEVYVKDFQLCYDMWTGPVVIRD